MDVIGVPKVVVNECFGASKIPCTLESIEKLSQKYTAKPEKKVPEKNQSVPPPPPPDSYEKIPSLYQHPTQKLTNPPENTKKNPKCTHPPAKAVPQTPPKTTNVTPPPPPPKECWAMVCEHKTRSAQSAERNVARQWPRRP